MDKNAGRANEHLSPQQRASEIVYYLQQAQAECRADIDKVEDAAAQELFGKIAGYLDAAIQALYSFQDRENAASDLPRRTLH
ncbi:MAG TPA: hypothetical protein VGS80_05260 [Ktedonobacterales bacterium]|nr:hypothetical protein [Ktedonobacterales bacterium]